MLSCLRRQETKAAVILLWLTAAIAPAFAMNSVRTEKPAQFMVQALTESHLIHLPVPNQPVVKAVLLFCLTTNGIHHQLEVRLSRVKELLTNPYERNPFYRLATIHAP
ncbi:MAG: hypothetical protein ACOYW3_14265 [Bacteroidota bacterium]